MGVVGGSPLAAQPNLGQEDPEPKNFQTWQLLHTTVYDDDTIRADLCASTRWFDDSSRLGVVFVQPQLYWKAQPWLDVGGAYFFAEVQANPDDDWAWEQRVMLIANVKHKPAEWIELSSRDWFEVRWFETRSGTNERFRLRPRVKFFPKAWGWDLGPLESVFFDNEFFLSLQGEVYRENRLTPFGMNFRVSENVVLQVFYMLRGDRLPSGTWEPTHVLGTYMCVAL